MFSLFIVLFISAVAMPDNLQDNDLTAIMNRIKSTDPDLYALAQNESSGGANLSHSEVTKGLNKGHTAGGPWGMMPITAKEVVGRSGAFKQQYPDVVEFQPEMITHVLNNDPQLAYALAKAEYERRLKALGGDKSKAAYSWLHGVTGTKQANPEDIIASEYVQKFLKNLPQNKLGQK